LRRLLFSLSLFLFAAVLPAQDFGFGFAEDDSGGETGGGFSSLPVSVKVGGSIAAEYLGFVHDFKDGDTAKNANLGNVLSGALTFSASGANVDAVIGLNLSAASIGQLFGQAGDPIYTPLILDEAYLRAYFGPVNIEAGLRKLTWGKADSLGPLDIVNPLDYSDLTGIDDIMAIKIARPLLHVSWNMDNFSKLETVFIPSFAGHRFSLQGRWTPSQFGNMYDSIMQDVITRATLLAVSNPAALSQLLPSLLNINLSDLTILDTNKLEYFQTGLRYTTTIGSADIGAQYFYGNLFRPVITLTNGVDAFFTDIESQLASSSAAPVLHIGLLSPVQYNRYHQLGLDYAQVLAGFNLRAEFAVHLTEDLKGDDGAVRNPFIGWSLGFDRDLVWGINANIQCNETIRLLNDKVGDNPALDCEAGTEATATRITARLSKKFLKDNLECKTTAIWDIEDKGCYIIPGIVWTIKDISAELFAGVLAGEESGELGQYWKNSFAGISLKYSF
jgi:hypothetical protein